MDTTKKLKSKYSYSKYWKFFIPFNFQQKDIATSKSTLSQLYPLQFQRYKTFLYFNYDHDVGENPALLLYICAHYVEKHEREMQNSRKINFVLLQWQKWIKSLGENPILL